MTLVLISFCQVVAYHYSSAYDHQDKIERLAPREFIARLATHIPNHNERLIRYSGVYANRSRKPGRARTPGETITQPSMPSRWRRQWQRLLQRVFHVTLQCPTCGTEMKVIAVITRSEPIHKILAHLKEKGIDARAGPFANKAA